VGRPPSVSPRCKPRPLSEMVPEPDLEALPALDSLPQGSHKVPKLVHTGGGWLLTPAVARPEQHAHPRQEQRAEELAGLSEMNNKLMSEVKSLTEQNEQAQLRELELTAKLELAESHKKETVAFPSPLDEATLELEQLLSPWASPVPHVVTPQSQLEPEPEPELELHSAVGAVPVTRHAREPGARGLPGAEQATQRLLARSLVSHLDEATLELEDLLASLISLAGAEEHSELHKLPLSLLPSAHTRRKNSRQSQK
jgi:hypothetical protein